LSRAGVVATANSDDGTVTLSGPAPYTVTEELYDPNTEDSWTGSGTYDVYLGLLSGINMNFYRKQNVSFASDTVSLSVDGFSPVSPEAAIGGFNITGYDGGAVQVFVVMSDPANSLDTLMAMASAYIGVILHAGINVNTVNWTNAPPTGIYTILVNYDYDGDAQSNGLVKITNMYIDSDGSGSADWNNRIVLASVN
jgi:hypothetical protein